jgi:D-hexose-6-phosphate mutarotase
MQSLKDLNADFAKPDRVTFETGEGGLVRAVLRTSKSEAHVYLYGAHLTHFAKTGEPPILFVSKQSLFKEGKAIRGGVPICFPWFGPKAGAPKETPMHGFARTSHWNVTNTSAEGADSSITLTLKDSAETQKVWPHKFTARFTVTLAPDTLSMDLDVANTGQSDLTYEAALHSYFTVTDIKTATVEGLGGVDYIDKTDGMAVKTQGGKPIKIVEETDRVYLGTRSTCTITDPGAKRKVVVAKENSDTTVLWNPWIAKAKAMTDFGDDEWQRMVCIETCNVNRDAVTLKAGAFHVTRAVISTTIV